MKRLLLAFLSVVLLALVAAGIVAWSMWQEVTSQGTVAFQPDAPRDVDFVVEKGQSPMAIARALKEKGLIADDVLFYRYARFVAEKAHLLKAGEYTLSPSMTTDEILAALQTGKKRELRFTVPEGLRKEEIADIIAASGVASKDELLKAMRDPALRKEFGVPDEGADGQKEIPGGIEGYLFPDTYQFPPNTPAKDVLRRMRARLDEVFTDEMRARMNEMGWNLHKVLTLAAIVEKETGQPHERPHIASVFHNRLRLGMKMQTDPTVIYGIENFDGNIRKKDLLTPHPYNTYTIKSLPPGPIASPGLAAIKAVLWPDDTKDLYFVSKNDGTHIFCPTLECHNAAVQKWQIEYFRQKRGG
jgi:UPF0755 protein